VQLFWNEFLAGGGALSGTGGFVETSSKGQLNFAGQVDTKAPNGTAGTLLLDPFDVVIGSGGGTQVGASTINVSDLVAQLGSGNVVVTTSGAGTQPGNITVAAPISWSTATTLSLAADNNVAINAAISATKGGLTLAAGGTIMATDAVNVASFTLQNGKWTQIATTLPAFSAQDFRITGGSFLRALAGDGTSGSPYQLTDIYGLQGVGSSAALRSANYVLANDIDATVTANWNSGAGFVPIGDISSGGFTGSLNGQNNTISNAKIGAPGSGDSNIGMFGAIGSGGIVQNLTLSNFTVTANSPGQFIGTLAGSNAGTISNVNASGGTVSGGTLSGVIAGGLVGQNGILIQNPTTDVRPLSAVASISSAGTIQYSTASVAVTVGNGCSGDCSSGTNVAGGLAGLNVANSTISNSYASGPVTGGSNSYLGGLVGQNGLPSSPGTISNSYSSASVSSTGTNVSLGGLAGTNEVGSTIAASFATGPVSDTATANNRGNCSSSCTDVTAGGLVAQNYGIIGTDPTSTKLSAPALTETCTGGFTCATGNVTVGNGGSGGAFVGVNHGAIGSVFALGSVVGGGTTATSEGCSATTRA
jgi:hypothetical protein